MKPTTVTLDKPRALRWTHRAEARIGSLAKPPEFSDLLSKNGRRAFYALAAHVWAALADKDAPFSDYEEVAAHLSDPERQTAAFNALVNALVEGGVIAEKKTSAQGANGYESGLSESSNSGAVARTSTTAPLPSGTL